MSRGEKTTLNARSSSLDDYSAATTCPFHTRPEMPASQSSRAFTGPCPALETVLPGKRQPIAEERLVVLRKVRMNTASVDVIGMPDLGDLLHRGRILLEASNMRRVHEHDGRASTAPSMSITDTAWVIVGRLCFFPFIDGIAGGITRPRARRASR